MSCVITGGWHPNERLNIFAEMNLQEVVRVICRTKKVITFQDDL